MKIPPRASPLPQQTSQVTTLLGSLMSCEHPGSHLTAHPGTLPDAYSWDSRGPSHPVFAHTVPSSWHAFPLGTHSELLPTHQDPAQITPSLSLSLPAPLTHPVSLVLLSLPQILMKVYTPDTVSGLPKVRKLESQPLGALAAREGWPHTITNKCKLAQAGQEPGTGG